MQQTTRHDEEYRRNSATKSSGHSEYHNSSYKYVPRNEGRKEENVLIDWNGETDTQHKYRLRQDDKDKWMTKPRHGHFLRQTREDADSKSWPWLASGDPKKETEGF